MSQERFLFTCEKNEYGASVKVFHDEEKVLDTFVNYGKNWFDLEQKNNYWFSSLTYKHFNVKELILSNRTEYIINYEYCKSVNELKKHITLINDYINQKLPRIRECLLFIMNL